MFNAIGNLHMVCGGLRQYTGLDLAKCGLEGFFAESLSLWLKTAIE